MNRLLSIKHLNLLRAVEEPRQDLVEVLRRDDLRKLDGAREAQAAIAQWTLDSWEALEQLRRSVPVVRGALRQAQLMVEKVEQARVAEVEPEPLPVELREGDEEIGQGAVLAAEQVGEAGGKLACAGPFATALG